VFLSPLLFIKPAHAGLFSFFEKIFSAGEGVAQTASVVNSQTITLLDAPTNTNPLAGVGGGETTYVENSALLPVVGPLGSLADAIEEQRRSDQISIYVVREGDNLSQIAELFGVTTNTIIWANDIKRGGLIKEGQTLIILPVTGVEYTVKKGDTIAGIAKKFKGDVDEILQFNDMGDGTALVVGENIIIPGGEFDTPTYVTKSYTTTVSDSRYAGYYIRPINGGRKSQGLHGYNGVDLAASAGTPVLASASGDVIISRSWGWNGGYGNYIVIKHPNGTQTLYSHLSKNIVQAGWHVIQGQVIGYIGSTGRSTGPHLHFEIRGGPRNPF